MRMLKMSARAWPKKLSHPALVSSLARSRQKLTDCGQELVRNGDHRLPLLFYHRGFIFGNLFVFGKFIVSGCSAAG